MAGEGVLGRGVCGRLGVHGAGRGGVRGRRNGHYSGRYASYWNTFLFFFLEVAKNNLTENKERTTVSNLHPIYAWVPGVPTAFQVALGDSALPV